MDRRRWSTGTIRLMRPPRRPSRVARVATCLVAAIVAVGCGADDPAPDEQPTPPAPAREPMGPGAEDEQPEQDEDADEEAVATPQARATGRRLDQLVAAYQPVSTRASFLVAAETLRADAVANGTDSATERERTGVVTIEARRMLQVLRAARPRVAASPVTDIEQQHVQQLLLDAIDARVRAVRELEQTLVVFRDPEATDTRVEELEEQWQASWDEAVRGAREATTELQALRARLLLDPAPEEAIR